MRNSHLYLALFFAVLFSTCQKETFEYKDNNSYGVRVEDFSLTAPADLQNIVLNAGTPAERISFDWEDSKTGLDESVRYRLLFSGTESFNEVLLSQESSDDGKASEAGVKHVALNSLFTDNNLEEAFWTVEAKHGNRSTLAKQAFRFTISPFGEGLTAFQLVSPENKSKLFIDKITAPDATHQLSWTKSNSVSGAEVTYVVEFTTVEDGFDEPMLSLPADDDGKARSLTFSNSQAIDLGIASATTIGGLYWRVVATAGEFKLASEKRLIWFEIFDIPNLYVLGDATSAGWNNNETDPIAFDNLGGGKFEVSTTLEAGKDIKFILTKGSWDVNWGGPDLGGNPVNLDQDYQLVSGGPNIKVPAASGTKYLISVDFTTNSFRLSESKLPENLYLVGGSVLPGWDPSQSVPFVKLDDGVFEQYQYATVAGDGFKFLIVQDWVGDWGADPNNSGKIIQEGESNVTVPEDGFYRIWVDFNTNTFAITKTDWGIIGSATPTGWDSDTDLVFSNTKGDYTWTIENFELVDGEYKFRANDDWGLNFGEDGGDGTMEYGGGNMQIGAGTYTIEMILDPINGYTYNIQ